MAYLNRDVRKEALLKATLNVMMRDGYAGTTTRSVAAEMGAANGIIHHHFRSAQELKREAIRHHVREQCAAFDAAAASLEPTDALKLAIDGFIRSDSEAEIRLWGEIWSATAHDREIADIYAQTICAWTERLLKIVETGLARGQFRIAGNKMHTVQRLLLICLGIGGLAFLPEQYGFDEKELISGFLRNELGI